MYKQIQMKSKCVKPLVQTLQFQAYATRATVMVATGGGITTTTTG